MKKIIGLLITLFLTFQFTTTAIATPDYGHVYCRNSLNSKKIALTFDDGPHPRYTEEILEILAEYNIKATFFIIGINAENYPQALQKIIASGCEIGNHTYNHTKINRLNQEEIKYQILKCEETLYRLSGIRPCIFRPPEGMLPSGINNIIKPMNYNVVLWSIDTMDWALTPSNQISKVVMDNIKGGDIILMHDYVSGGNTTCDALKIIIPQILSEGYEFVTVSELINGRA